MKPAIVRVQLAMNNLGTHLRRNQLRVVQCVHSQREEESQARNVYCNSP